MNRIWKAVIVIALGLAIIAVVGAKSKSKGRSVTPSPTAVTPLVSAQTPVSQAAAPGADPAPSTATHHTAPPVTPRVPSSSRARDEAAPQQKPKPQPQAAPPPTPTSAPARPQAAPKQVETPRESRAPVTPPPSTPARRPQLIELGSKTCTPCKMMAPILGELRQDYGSQLEVTFYDIYERRDMADTYHIRVIPTQVFLDAEGKEFFRHQGFYPKDEILAKFREHGITLESR